MSKTYTLTATKMLGGTYHGWSSASWGSMYSFAYTKVGLEIVDDEEAMRATSIMFDQSTLATLRSKNITSIKLKISFSGTIPAQTASDSLKYQVGYKLNSSETDWKRSSGPTSTSAGTYTIAYIRTSNSSSQSGGSITLDMGSNVPLYGYVAGPYGPSYGVGDNITLTGTPTLTVVTDEVDIWINNNGTWIQGFPWVNNNGTWVRGTRVWVNSNGTWISTS